MASALRRFPGLARTLAGCCALVMWSTVAWAQKTDVITLDNGDTVTCEIQELERGRLRCKTDAMGTVYIKWQHVVDIETDKIFEVELSTGESHVGSIKASGTAEEMNVAAGAAITSLPQQDVAFVRQVDPTFWGRLDGGIDLGASFTQADGQVDYSMNADVVYTGQLNSVTLDLSSWIKIRDDATATNRQTLGGQWLRDLRWPRWFSIAVARFEHNDELGLDGRGTGGYGIGRFLAQTNRWTWAAYVTGQYSRERFQGTEAGGNELNVGFGTDLQVFTFGDHETDISTQLEFLPSLTTSGRYRFRLNTKVRREFFSDLYFSVDFFETHDSDPPRQGRDVEKNDYGLTTALGWSFR